ncbi:MAG: YitT family protein [Syntrophomonadaceae bacterium]|nr:YitT family protein [Syntrophomonadaceae bacterium]
MHNRFSVMAKKLGFIWLGNTIYALAVVMFILPNGLITGGTTGLALIINHFTGFSIAVFIAAFNITMFILGYALLGRTFALSTLISTLYYPLALGASQTIAPLQHMTSDRLLAAIYAGIMIGFSIGIVIKAGASTGGLDIPPLILNKKFGFSVAGVLYGFDFVILLAQMLFADKEQVLYGILMVFIYTVVLDKILLLGQSRTQVQIVSEQYQEINRRINERIDRGSTLIHAETGHLHNQSMVVLTVVANRELPRLNELVLSIDPKAFMIINRVNEVKGRGFTLEKINK